MNRDELDKIEIRSEEVQEILGYIPHWIIRSGITVVFIVVLFLLTGSWFFKYPDVISAPIVITTHNIPVSLVSKTTGMIHKILISDNSTVNSGQVIALIENPANHKDVFELNSILDSLQELGLYRLPDRTIILNPNYELGQIQSSYINFHRKYIEYFDFIKIDYYQKKIQALHEEAGKLEINKRILIRQEKIMQSDMELSQKQFGRDSLLFMQNVIPELEFEKSKQLYLQKKYNFESFKATIVASDMQSGQLHQNILDLQIQELNSLNTIKAELKANFDILKSEIEAWKQIYTFTSPVDGIVIYSAFWAENQNVNTGDIVFTVSPHNKSVILGKVELPISGAGKVRHGQEINIKLDSYPYMEYGIIKASVESVSKVSTGQFYSVSVKMPQKLTTNYDIDIEYSPAMQGNATIITEKISVLERLFNPLKLLLNLF